MKRLFFSIYGIVLSLLFLSSIFGFSIFKSIDVVDAYSVNSFYSEISDNYAIKDGAAIIPDTPEDTNNSRLDFTRFYFSHLTSNFGENIHGSCGYVAAEMLLIYFDSYWNDDIVAENFDKNETITDLSAIDISTSPGAIEDPIPDYLKYDSMESLYYNEMISNNYNSSLHAYLLKIGHELNTGLGTTLENTNNILNAYFEQNERIDKEDMYFSYVLNLDGYAQQVPNKDYTYSEYYKNIVVGYVKMGIPVILSIVFPNDDGTLSGHALVAYDYNEETDTLYGHFGWRTGDEVIDKFYAHMDVFFRPDTCIRGYFLITTEQLEHKHSNNYIYNGDHVCSCHLGNHAHNYKYTSISEYNHKATCFCDDIIVQNHNFMVVGNNYVCKQCKYKKPYNGGGGPITITPFNIEQDMLNWLEEV